MQKDHGLRRRVPAWDALQSALQSILSHKLRSLLTLTGIVIGVLAVVSMFSSVYALKRLINQNMEGMGWNYSVVVTADQEDFMGSRRRVKRRVLRRASQSVRRLNYDDYLALRQQLPLKSSYAMIESGSILRLGNKDIEVRMRAADQEFFANKSYGLLQGRYYNRYEEDNLLPVLVLGYHFAKEQFGSANPVGKPLQLGDRRFQIVGVLAEDQINKDNDMNFNSWERRQDLSAVYVPLKYGVYNFGTNKGLHMIYLQARSEREFSAMKNQARQLLLARHRMYPNFGFLDIGQMMLTITHEISGFMEKWNITLIAIASISLIVGGIGLFSTLLISIQERMTEIGVRKSIGATDRDIFVYFILEAIMLATLGALLGIALAWLILTLIGKAISFPLYLPLQGVALGLFFSILTGFLSGLYPAIRAASIDPIQASYYFE